jgi:hypothetical protein
MADMDSTIQDSSVVTRELYLGDVHNNIHNHVKSVSQEELHCPSCKTDHPEKVKISACFVGKEDCEKTCDNCEEILKKKYPTHFDISGICGICVEKIYSHNDIFIKTLRKGILPNWFSDRDERDYNEGSCVPYFIENDFCLFDDYTIPFSPNWKDYFDYIDNLVAESEEDKKRQEQRNKVEIQNRALRNANLKAYERANKKPKQNMYVMEVSNKFEKRFEMYESTDYYATHDPQLDEHGKQFSDREGKYQMIKEIKPQTRWQNFKLFFEALLF